MKKYHVVEMEFVKEKLRKQKWNRKNGACKN